MRAFYAFFLLTLLLSYTAKAAERPILDCNFNFDYIAQIQVFQDSSGALSYRLLTNTGRWLDRQPIEAAQWEARDIRFEARGRSFDGGFYRFYSPDGRQWGYQVRRQAGDSPSTVGGADCD